MTEATRLEDITSSAYITQLAAAAQWMILSGLEAERAVEKYELSQADIPRLNELRAWAQASTAAGYEPFYYNN